MLWHPWDLIKAFHVKSKPNLSFIISNTQGLLTVFVFSYTIEVGIRSMNKPKRVQRCQERLEWTEEEWKRVVWTEESNFSTAGFSHRPWVTRLLEEEFNPDCIDEVWGSGREGIMVWGAFYGEMKSLLYIVPPGTTINSKRYRHNVMMPYLAPFWNQTCEEYRWCNMYTCSSNCIEEWSAEFRMFSLITLCNDPTIGSYNDYHLSPNGIPSGNQRWYGLVYLVYK